MAELEMSWVTEGNTVKDTMEKRDASEFDGFDI